MQMELLKDSICAKTHDPIYTVHRYFARRPHNVISNIINHYSSSKEDLLILDPFGGGGSTLIESLALHQRVISCDTSDLAAFIMSEEAAMASVEESTIEQYVLFLQKKVAETFSKVFSFDDREVYWIMWSTYTECPFCNEDIELRPETARGNGNYECGKCNSIFKPKNINANQVRPTAICLIDRGSFESGIPVNPEIIYPPTKTLTNFYNSVLKSLDSLGFTDSMHPEVPIPDCNLQRESALHKKGINYYEEFIPIASRAVVSFYAENIMKLSVDDEMKRHLLFIVSASLRYSARFSTINQAWRGKTKPLEWAKSNFWTPYTFVEANPMLGFYDRWNSYKRGIKSAHTRIESKPINGTLQDMQNHGANYCVLNQSSTDLSDLGDACVDLIVTDPPYGSYLNYGELAGFWTAWLSKYLPDIKAVPDREKEAVPARKKGYPGWKNFDEYEEILFDVFTEAYRVLKPNSFCVVTFNNKEPEAWIAFLRAVKRAGFELPQGGVIFQDGVQTYKRTIDSRRSGAIFGDFIYSFKKCSTSSVSGSFCLEQAARAKLAKLSNTTKEIPYGDLYTELYFDILPKFYHSIDTSVDKPTSAFSMAELTHLVEEYFIRNGSTWLSKESVAV